MSEGIRNEWLDLSDSGGSVDHGYQSESMEDSRTGRARKRRRLSTDSQLAESEESEPEVQSASVYSRDRGTKSTTKIRGDGDDTRSSVENIARSAGRADADSMKNKSKPRKLSKQDSVLKSKSGVIYISRVPPFMKPSTLKSLLSPHGSINRVFLTPEDPSAHSLRVKSGGNKKRSFIDGWVEFVHKRDAKLAAENLNTQIIGGKKGGWYHDDVWNVKYLKGFKWHHLTEQIANENAERAARLRTEIAQTTRENKRFVLNVERAKMLEGMQAKKLKRQAQSSAYDPSASDGQGEAAVEENSRYRSYFRQNEVKRKGQIVEETSDQPEVKRVLSKIF